MFPKVQQFTVQFPGHPEKEPERNNYFFFFLLSRKQRQEEAKKTFSGRLVTSFLCFLFRRIERKESSVPVFLSMLEIYIPHHKLKLFCPTFWPQMIPCSHFPLPLLQAKEDTICQPLKSHHGKQKNILAFAAAFRTHKFFFYPR